MKKNIKILKTNNWKVILIKNQYYLGRSIIIYKGEAIHISQLPTKHFIELKEIIDKLENSLIKTFGATHFNWTCLMNNYYKPQNRNKKKELHLHLWPRYENVVKIEGERFKDEVFGHHYDKYKEKTVSPKILEIIADKITSNLN